MSELEFAILYNLSTETYKTRRAIKQFFKQWHPKAVEMAIERLMMKDKIDCIKVQTHYGVKSENAYCKIDD